MNLRLATLLSASCLFQVSVSLQTPIFSIFIFQLLGDLRHTGGVIALYTLSMAASSTFTSYYLLRYKFAVLIFSYMSFSLYALMLYSQPSLIEFYLIQLFGGMVGGMGWAAFFRIFVSIVEKGYYTRYYSINKLTTSIFGALAALSSGYIAHYAGIRDVFIVMSVACILAAVVVGLLYLSNKGCECEEVEE